MGASDSAPWKQEGFSWREHLSGPPLKLLVICTLQCVLLVIGVLVGIGRASCPITVRSGDDVQVNCGECIRHKYITWQQAALLAVGLAIILVGVIAAFLRRKSMCRVYGLIMLIYAFILGLTSLLTGLDTIVLEDAAKQINEADQDCANDVHSMISTSKINAVLFAVNCLLDIAGAVYAIKARELFEFQEIASHHTTFHKQYAQL